MGFQKCPVCNGTGKHSEFGLTDATCPVCEGKRIINEMTGRPPQDSKPTIIEKMVNPSTTSPYRQTLAGINDYLKELKDLSPDFELTLTKHVNLFNVDGKEKE